MKRNWLSLVFFLGLGLFLFSGGCQLAEWFASGEEEFENGEIDQEDHLYEDNLDPQVSFLDSRGISPGEHVELEVSSFPYPPLEITLNGGELEGEISKPWWDGDTIYLALGADYDNPPGEYEPVFQVSYLGKSGLEEKELTFHMELESRDYPEQQFSMPGEPAEDWPQEELEKQAEWIKQARNDTSRRPLWSGDFIRPLEGRITSEFGAIRIINDNPPRRHDGIDIGANQGAPVKATQSGQVRLADSLLAPGKTVIIDHGLGISSAYLHLHEIKVETEQWVEKEEVIGTVGQTGFATGPHLHWEIRLGELPLDPEKFLEAPLYIDGDNYRELVK